MTSATYRQQSAMYVNVTPGDYVVNITTGGAGSRRILAQEPVTFEPGDVRTVLVQNTAHAAVPSPANHKLTVLLDARYGQ